MITALTPEQEAKLPKYREKAIEVGLATGDGTMDEAKVLDLINQQLIFCNQAPISKLVVRDSPMAVCSDPSLAFSAEDKPTPSNAMYGQHDVNWLYHYAFFRFELGLVKETEGILPRLELAKHIGWWWLHEDFAIVTHRPIKIHLIDMSDGLKRLHNPNGLALEYKDGNGLYMLRGMRFSQEYSWFFTPDKSAPDFAARIMKVTNTELRSEMIRAMGPAFMVEQLGKKVIDKDSTATGGEYELYTVEIEGQTRTYLTGVCPSKGDRWYEAVHPDCRTVKQANSWRYYGEITNDYQEPSIAT